MTDCTVGPHRQKPLCHRNRKLYTLRQEERSTVGTQPSKEIETFPNPEPGRNYEVQMTCPEFTCLCPRTGQPDFATLTLTYVREGIDTVITVSYQPDEQA